MTAATAPAAAARAPSVARRRRPLWLRILRIVALVVAILLVLVAVLLATAVVRRGQTVELPRPTGASPVGRVEFVLTDTARPDPFVDGATSRSLPIWLWYPSSGGTSSPAPYVSSAWAAGADTADGVFASLRQDLRSVKSSSTANAAMRGTPPVVILFPGLGLSIPDYTTLAEDLASRGYAVVGVNEPGSSGAVAYPDGHVVFGSPKGNIDPALLSNPDGWYSAAGAITTNWVADARFVVESLKATPPSVGALDFSRVSYVGHSLGGAAAFEVCHEDSSCAAAVDLDGTLWTDVRHSGLTAPGLILESTNWPDDCAGDVFCQRARADYATVKGAGNVRRFVLDGSKHLNYSDAGVRFEPLRAQVGALGSIDGTRALTITREVVASFIDNATKRSGAKPFDSAVAQFTELRER